MEAEGNAATPHRAPARLAKNSRIAGHALLKNGMLSWETPGPYDGPAVYQEFWPLPQFGEKHFAVTGSWIVNGWACGVGMREDTSPVTGNLSRFLPHIYQ
jgi:glutathionylspermidine synthase